jgi:hypothetical protein
MKVFDERWKTWIKARLTRPARTATCKARLKVLAVIGVVLLMAVAKSDSACVAVPAGLVGWWRGETNALDETSGNNGVLVGNASFGTGKSGKGFVFDGQGDGVAVSNSPVLRLQDFSIEAWIKRASTTVASLDPVGSGGIFYSSEGGYGFGIWDNGQLVLTKIGDSGVVSLQAITDTNFHHVAVTKNGSTVYFYLDGNPEQVADYDPGFVFGGPFAVGTRGGDFVGSLLGLVDEVSVYNRALSAEEIQAIYSADGTGKCSLPPAILIPPTDQAVCAGSAVVFSVKARGSPPLSYYWRYNGEDLQGQTNASLTLTNVQVLQGGLYDVRVVSGPDSVISDAANLSISVPPPCATAPAGLVGWWRGEGNGLDDGGGSHGSLRGNATYGQGQVSRGLLLGGEGDALSIGNQAVLRLQNFTIEAWIKRSDSSTVSHGPTGAAVIFGFGHGGYAMAMDSGGHIDITQVDISGVVLGTAITDTNFHHVAVTKSGSNIVFYIDSSAYPVPAYNPVFSFTTGAAIGSRGDYFANSFLGFIDEVSVYNRPLSGSEITSLYNAGCAGKCDIAPAILIQPQSQTVNPGTNVTFSPAVSGTRPLNLQWYFNNSLISGATNSSLIVSNAASSKAGSYYLTVSNVLGGVVSSNAVLKIAYVTILGNGKVLTNSQYNFGGLATIQLRNFYTNGAVFYTLDGTEPTFSSTLYNGPFVVSNNCVIRTLGYSPDFSDSGLSDPISIMILPTYNLTIIPSGGGTVTLNPSTASYTSGSSVTASAVAGSGWTFLQWLGDAGGTNPVAMLIMDRNKSVQAIFGTHLTRTSAGGGSVSLNPLGGFYPYGTVIQVTAVPDAGKYFVLWGNAASGNSNPLQFALTNSNPTISSLFSSLPIGQVSLAVVPMRHGTVSVSPAANLYNQGQVVTVSALPENGHLFLGWSGDATGTENPLSVTLNQSKTILASFDGNNTLTSRSLGVAGFELFLNGEFATAYRLEASSNLLDWTGLITFTNAVGSFHYIDPGATNLDRRFYRAVTVP